MKKILYIFSILFCLLAVVGCGYYGDDLVEPNLHTIQRDNRLINSGNVWASGTSNNSQGFVFNSNGTYRDVLFDSWNNIWRIRGTGEWHTTNNNRLFLNGSDYGTYTISGNTLSIGWSGTYTLRSGTISW